MMGTLAIWVALAAAAVGCVFSAIYHAMVQTSRTDVESLAEERSGKAAAESMGRMMDHSGVYARATGLVALAAFGVAAMGMVEWIAALRANDRPDWLDGGLGVLAVAVLGWLVGVAAPMSVATYAGARVIWSTRSLSRLAAALVTPLEVVARGTDEVVRRLAGAERRHAGEQVQRELLSVIEEGEAKGAFDDFERKMIEAVVSFKDLTVQQIMTPRPSVEAMELSNDLGQVIKTVKALRHSRIPVYGESLDQVVGIFYVKDLMHWLAGDGSRVGGKPFELKNILRPARFVPETKTVRELLDEMVANKVHIAMVADEYGGTAGLVTIEDIVEQIVGDIRDEYEAPQAELPDVVLKPEQNRADVDAAARIMDVNGALESLGVQIPESEDYDTVGGFVVTTLGRIPSKGESFDHERMRFTILEAKPTRVVKVSLEVRPEPDEAGAGARADGQPVG
ncbi:MAG: HlyC/CorC family transporter [Phycisphaerae bacterium]|nr:HlyC/CorC family transporter [Phycisphaerae bacterium]